MAAKHFIPIFSLKVDFSRNAIRRLNKDVLEGLEDDLLDLRLDHNLLGNSYNPIFASQEIAKLTALQVRDGALWLVGCSFILDAGWSADAEERARLARSEGEIKGTLRLFSNR